MLRRSIDGIVPSSAEAAGPLGMSAVERGELASVVPGGDPVRCAPGHDAGVGPGVGRAAVVAYRRASATSDVRWRVVKEGRRSDQVPGISADAAGQLSGIDLDGERLGDASESTGGEGRATDVTSAGEGGDDDAWGVL